MVLLKGSEWLAGYMYELELNAANVSELTSP
jgi:hypothetical protein